MNLSLNPIITQISSSSSQIHQSAELSHELLDGCASTMHTANLALPSLCFTQISLSKIFSNFPHTRFGMQRYQLQIRTFLLTPRGKCRKLK